MISSSKKKCPDQLKLLGNSCIDRVKEGSFLYIYNSYNTANVVVMYSRTRHVRSAEAPSGDRRVIMSYGIDFVGVNPHEGHNLGKNI